MGRMNKAWGKHAEIESSSVSVTKTHCRKSGERRQAKIITTRIAEGVEKPANCQHCGGKQIKNSKLRENIQDGHISLRKYD